MAISDNVVRAGLTPKFKDISTLVDMLIYTSGSADEQKIHTTEYPNVDLGRDAPESTVRLYDPPIEEFSVVRSVLHGGGARATFAPVNGPSIIICISGKGQISVCDNHQTMDAGYVFFVGCGTEYVIESSICDDAHITFKAFCEKKVD